MREIFYTVNTLFTVRVPNDASDKEVTRMMDKHFREAIDAWRNIDYEITDDVQYEEDEE